MRSKPSATPAIPLEAWKSFSRPHRRARVVMIEWILRRRNRVPPIFPSDSSKIRDAS